MRVPAVGYLRGHGGERGLAGATRGRMVHASERLGLDLVDLYEDELGQPRRQLPAAIAAVASGQAHVLVAGARAHISLLPEVRTAVESIVSGCGGTVMYFDHIGTLTAYPPDVRGR